MCAPSQRKEVVSIRARGAVVGVVSSTPVGIGVLFGSPEESGSAGWGGQFPGDPPQPGWFIYKASALGQKEAPGVDTTGPAAGVGSARALTLWRGSPGKAPRAPFSAPPRHKSGRRKLGERELVNSNVPRTPGGRFVNNLPFSVARPGGVAPPPCKSAAFQEAFEIGLGFLSSYFFSLFSVSFLTSSGPPPPDSPSPLPSFLSRPPPPLPFVK